MQSSGKLILRKKELRTLTNCKDIQNANASSIVEIDLSFNGLE